MNVYPPGSKPPTNTQAAYVTPEPTSNISYKGLSFSNGWIIFIAILIMALMAGSKNGSIAVIAIALSASVYQLVNKK